MGRALVLGGLALIAGFGCGQAKGERCEIQSDCASGLICDLGVPTPQGYYNGTCKSPVVAVPNDVDVGVVPPPADAAAETGAHDGASLVDGVGGPRDGMPVADVLISTDVPGTTPDVAPASDTANTD